MKNKLAVVAVLFWFCLQPALCAFGQHSAEAQKSSENRSIALANEAFWQGKAAFDKAKESSDTKLFYTAFLKFEKAHNLAPDLASPCKWMGLTLFVLGKTGCASQAVAEAIRLDPADEDAYQLKFYIDLKRGAYAEAETTARQAVQRFPQSAQLHYQLGVALNNLNKRQEAVKSLRQAVELKSDYVEAHEELGNAYYELGQLDAAASAYAEVVKLKPGNDEVIYRLGSILITLKRFDEARVRIRQLRETQSPYSFDYLGERANVEERIYKAELGVKASPRNPRALYELADALLQPIDGFIADDNDQRIIELLQKAVQLKPTYAEARFLLATCYIEQHNLSAAQAQLRKLKSLNKRLANKLAVAIKEGRGIRYGVPGRVPGGVPGGIPGYTEPPFPAPEAADENATPEEIAASRRVSFIRKCLQGSETQK